MKLGVKAREIWSVTNEELQEDCGQLFGFFELRYLAEMRKFDRRINLSTIYGEIRLTLKLWQIPVRLAWLNPDTNPFEKIVDVGKEITDSLFTVLGYATQVGEVVDDGDESKPIEIVPRKLHILVDVETENGTTKTWGRGVIQKPDDEYFWRMEIRTHRLRVLKWALESAAPNHFVRFN